MDDQQQCLEPLLQITGSINILPVDLVIDTRSINTLSLLKKSSESRTKNVLEYLETRPNTSSKKKLRIKTNYTHCTYNFNAQVTDDFVQNPLPADQQLGRQQLTRCGQPVQLQQLNPLWTISIHFATQNS